MQDGLSVVLKPSRWFLALLAICAVIAAAACLSSSLAAPIKLLILAALAGVYSWRYRVDYLIKGDNTIIAVHYHRGAWRLDSNARRSLAVALLPSHSAFTEKTIALSFIDQASSRLRSPRYHVLLLPDSASADQLRRLRIVLNTIRMSQP